MYDLRYHVASLIAVFFALALGLMLGSVVAERGYLDAQQSALVEGLQADFQELSETNDQLRADYERDHAFATQIALAYAGGLLDGQTILVMSNEGRTDGLAATNEAIRGAGGRVLTAMVLEPGLGLDAAVVHEALLSIAPTETPEAERDLAEEVLVALVAELMTPTAETPYMDALDAVDVFRIEGWDPTTPIDGVIVMTSFDGTADPSIVRLTAMLRDAGATALGVEVSWQEPGIVDACLESGLSAVDSIDLPQGSLSAVLILAGRAEGHFGTGGDAAAPYPQLSFD